MKPQTVLERARELHEEARSHKTAARRHQKLLRRTLAELQEICDRHGITLATIDTDQGRSKSDEHHHRTD